MKFNKLSVVLVFLSLLTAGKIVGQSEVKKIRTGIFIGYPLGLFDLPKSGFHLSINPTYSFNQHLAAEGQLSYSKMNFKRSDNFFGHDGGDAANFNLLVGLRLYILKEKHKTRPYLRVLYGYGAGHNTEYNANGVLAKEKLVGVSGSADFCLEVNKKWNFGLGLEGSYPSIGLKVGYTI
jgi:hypothetical protein